MKIKTQMVAKLITFFFLFPLASYSQSNFKKAYFVNNDNDTIRGLINYKDLSGTPRSFSFRLSETATESEIFSISQVRYFSIEGYQDFQRHFVSISMNEIALDKIYETEPGDRSDTIFLKVLLKGNRLDLFSYTDKIKTRYYVKETGQESPVELLFKQDGQKTLPIFQQQLSTLAIKYNKLSDQVNNNIRSAHYTRPAIVKIVSGINDNVQENFSATKDKKQKLRFFLGAGINYNRLTYKGQNIITYEMTTTAGPIKYRDQVTHTSYVPAIAIGIDMFSNPDIQRLIIRNEITASFLKSKTRSVYQFYYPEEKVAYEYTLSAITIAYAPQLIYNFYNAKNLKWNVGAGPSFFFWSYPVNESHQQPLTQSSIYSDMVTENYMKLNKTSVGLIVRSGFLVNNRLDIGLKALVNPSHISNKERTTTMTVSLINVGVNYLFSRK